MDIQININTDNDSFGNGDEVLFNLELSYILTTLSFKASQHELTDSNIKDSNGNTVGYVKTTNTK